MRKLLVPAAAAALLATSALSFAATQQHATGTVKAYDAKAQTLTLADGSVYMLPKTFKNPGLKAGEKVSINWEMKGSNRSADQVMIVK
jgi:Cu/Ag efflux protein CusF